MTKKYVLIKGGEIDPEILKKYTKDLVLKRKLIKMLKKNLVVPVSTKEQNVYLDNFANQILEVVEKEENRIRGWNIIEAKIKRHKTEQEVLDEIRKWKFYVSEKLEQNAKSCYELVEKFKSWQEKIK